MTNSNDFQLLTFVIKGSIFLDVAGVLDPFQRQEGVEENTYGKLSFLRKT